MSGLQSGDQQINYDASTWCGYAMYQWSLSDCAALDSVLVPREITEFCRHVSFNASKTIRICQPACSTPLLKTKSSRWRLVIMSALHRSRRCTA